MKDKLNNNLSIIKTSILFVSLILLSFLSLSQVENTEDLPFPINNNYDPTGSKKQRFDLGDPSSVKKSIVYDPISGKYIFKETYGKNNDLNFRNPSMMTFEEYLDYEKKKSLQNNWKEKIDEQTKENQAIVPPIKIPGKAFRNIFGSDEISIKPQGSVEISLGVNSSRYDNPMLPVKQRRITRMDFQPQMQLSLTGQIGTRIKTTATYSTQAGFDFENVVNLAYSGDEDQILQKLEMGNVSMPLKTSLIEGSQTLFGVKTQMRFGRLTVDAIAASNKGKKQEINIAGKAQVQNFEITADNYEANRHYYLSHYFEQQYDKSMSELPIVSSEVNITKIEVWVTNRASATENTRNVLAFTDLGESQQDKIQGGVFANSSDIMPDNNSNNLYSYLTNQPAVRKFATSVPTLSIQTQSPGPFQQAIHYEKVENARRLNEQEFSYNSLLGFISLNQALNNDEVLAVAFQYTYRGKTYQVGEFSTDGVANQDALMLKLLKPTITNPKLKLWKLMMKNVYSIGAYQLDKQGFRMDLLYNNPETSLPINFLPYDGLNDKQIVTLLEMDKINSNNQPFSDGLFDFAPMNFSGNKADNGGTINTKNGRIYFTTTEPFGKTLANKLKEIGTPDPLIKKIAFTELYDSTKTAAQQIPSKNRFLFKGQYQSSVSSDIALNALNVPQGAVVVTAGGIRLTEGTDFTVDYNLGRVKILNSSILESNTPIKISIESNSVFGFQAKSLLGTHLNYKFSENFNLGATWMRMMERPITQKVDIGSEPYKNNVLGLDLSINKEVPFLTKLVDYLPVISTRAKSTISFKGEVAHLIPGVPKAITKDGISYVDDFEGSQSSIDLKSTTAWKIATTPQGQPDLFPEGNYKTLSNGYKRAKLSWYTIDLLFYQNNSYTPQHIKDDPSMLSDSRMRLVQMTDIFPNLQQQMGQYSNVNTLDIAYYPKERGMYNYDTSNVDENGLFLNPQNRWGGISRALSTNDFEQSNIEFIQFWMLDPFNEDAENVNPNTIHSGGDLYFNLGNISEDVLADSRKSFENGLPLSSTSDLSFIDTTSWARLSTQQVVVNAFDNDPSSRVLQDVGLDGWNNDQERQAFSKYVTWIQNNTILNQTAKSKLNSDPSSDDYTYYRDDNYDNDKANILTRYKRYNGTQGNSYTTEMSDTANVGKYPTQATNTPDNEDINQDNNLSESESYFQYKVSLKPGELEVGKNYITNIQEYKSGNKTERWLQFKVPLAEPQKVVNGISDFRSIRFMRMFLNNFDEEVVLRFAKLEFIRGEWRRFKEDLTAPGESIQTDPNSTLFNIGAVNIEENSERQPIKYVIPPGIQREIDPSQVQQRQMNEQAMSLQVCDLKDGGARAAIKNVQFDVRTYKKMKMFVHAEQVSKDQPLNNEDLTLFIRLGTDYTENYYEYELPLYLTAWGANLDTDVWPESNMVEINFDDLIALKQKRNGGSTEPSASNMIEYIITDPKNSKRLLKIKGSPNLQGIRSIMIGIRNPRKNTNKIWNDDGLSKCAIVWVNELYLTDFQNKGGSAALAQLQVQAADFANVGMSTSYKGVNWGSIESRVQERQRNEQINFDFNSTVQLGQFFGSKLKLSLPFFYGYSLGVINPEYDPFNPDVRLKEYEDASERKRRRKLGQDFNERRSYNFTNVRKERKEGAKPHIYDISNLAFSYGYSEQLKRDFNTEFDRTKIWTGGLNYNYSFNTKAIEPFKKVKFMQKSNWWAIIKDINFFLAPKNLSFTNDLTRNYNERKIRNNLAPDYEFAPVYVKSFFWNRKYGFGYDLTKNLKFTFNATNRAMFDEPNGQIDRKQNPENYRVFKDSIRSQMSTFGKTTDYSHDYALNYNLPLDKIPALNWITTNTKYSGTFNWQRGPLGQTSYGNTIQNSRVVNVTTQLNFVNLYNKVPFFKKVLSDGKQPRGGVQTKKPPVTKPNPNEKPESEMTAKELRKKKRKEKREERKKKRDEIAEKKRKGKVHPIVGFTARLIMTVRNVSGSYNVNDGTLLPGYNQETRILGFSNGFNAPLSGFVFGQQRYGISGNDKGYNIAEESANRGWLVKNQALNKQFTQSHSQGFTAKATLEPMKDITVELNLNRNYTNNAGEYYRWNEQTNQYESQSRMETATLTYSTITIGTAFVKNSKEYRTKTFDQLRENRAEASSVLGRKNPNSSQLSNGYYSGYNGTQQEVVVGAFLSAYTGKSVNEKRINPLKNTPLPNWTVNYNGLTKFEKLKKLAKNFVIKHAYSSNVNISGIQSNLMAQLDSDGNPIALDANNNFISSRQFQNMTISERFSPLIGVDATWNIRKQGLITKVELKKDRSASLALSNNQVTEVTGTEWVFGTGYKFGKVRMPFKINGKNPENDLNIRFDFSLRNNLTVIRKIEENTNQATAGQRVISIKSSADYLINQNVTLQLYYDQVINTPKIQTSYPTGNISAGLRLRINLGGL